MRLPPALVPLRHRIFRALWSANVVSSLGTWMQNTGAGWLMTTLAPTPLMVSLVQAATLLPVFLLALPAGALADIADRRLYLIGTQGWMLAAAALLAVLTLMGHASAWALLALTFAIGVGSAMNMPAWAAIVPEMVPRADLVQAVALNGIGFNLARAIGPALAGALLLLGGAALTFGLNALSFVGVIAVLIVWRRAATRSTLPPEHLASAMRAGMRFVRHTPAMRAAVLRSMAYFFPAAAPWALLPLVVRAQLGLDAGVFGVLLGLMGVGGVAAGLLLPNMRRRAGQGLIVTLSTLCSAGGTALLGLSHHAPPAALAMLIFGVGWVAGSATMQAAAQLVCPPWVRARALAIYQLAYNGALAAGSFFWGWLGTRIGLADTLLAAAATGAVLALATARLRLDSEPPARPTAPQPAGGPVPETARMLRRARGRVLETMRYRVPPAQRRAFLAAMAEVRHVRGRAGAASWQLYEDAGTPDSWLETWVLESWTDHLRERSRLSEEDKDILARLHPWRDGALPGRFIAIDPVQRTRRPAGLAPAARGD